MPVDAVEVITLKEAAMFRPCLSGSIAASSATEDITMV